MEVVEAVVEVWPRNRISVRISPTNPAQFEIYDSDPEGLFCAVVDRLREIDIGFLDVVEGATSTFEDQCDFDFGLLRSRFKNTYIANNRYTYETGTRAIQSGHSDLVSFGRPFLANPDLVERFRIGAGLNEVNRATMYHEDGTGYIDYPVLAENVSPT